MLYTNAVKFCVGKIQKRQKRTEPVAYSFATIMEEKPEPC